MPRKKTKQHYCGIGGQAVLDGIMMRNGADYAIAVRKADGAIALEKKTGNQKKKSSLSKIPFVRGVVNFTDSLTVGFQSLNFSAEAGMEDDEEEPGRFELFLKKHFGDKANDIIMTCTVFAAVVLAVAVFILLPYGLSALLGQFIVSRMVLSVFEGIIRLAIFIAYVTLIGLMDDIDRMYMYHGAEHKCINCIERGKPLTVQNVRRSSRLHPRCGTSFMLYVMVISCVLFFFIQVSNPLLRLLYRLLLIPIIAGVSYELIRLAGRSANPLVKLLNLPGLGLQRLSTREPEDEMIEVAIQAVEAVFDWKTYQEETFRVQEEPEEYEEEHGEDESDDGFIDDDSEYDDFNEPHDEYAFGAADVEEEFDPDLLKYVEYDSAVSKTAEYEQPDENDRQSEEERNGSQVETGSKEETESQTEIKNYGGVRTSERADNRPRTEEEAGREIEELLEHDL